MCAVHLFFHAEKAIVQREAFSNIISKLLVQPQEYECLMLQIRDHFCWLVHLGSSWSYLQSRWQDAFGLPQSSKALSVLRGTPSSYEDGMRSQASGLQPASDNTMTDSHHISLDGAARQLRRAELRKAARLNAIATVTKIPPRRQQLRMATCKTFAKFPLYTWSAILSDL